jgi:diguanylate cyclase (GGDEF)-like protein
VDLFRNVGIRSRIITTTLLLVLLPGVVFLYIRLMDLPIALPVYLFLLAVFLLVALVSSWVVASTVTSPIDRIRRRIRGFLEKKVAQPIKDDGQDEVNTLGTEVNRLFATVNAEKVSVLKKERGRTEKIEQVETVRGDFDRQLSLTRSCLEVARELNTTFDFQTNLKTLLDSAVKTMNVQWASILLSNRETLELNVVCVRGIEQSLLDDLAEDNYPAVRIKPNEGLAGLVLKEGLPLIANKGHKDPRFKVFSEFSSRDEKIASILCCPIKGSDGTVLGVFNFINRISPPFFRPEDLPHAEDLCTLAVLAIERQRLYRTLFADPSTGLASHGVWKVLFAEEAGRAVRYSQPLTVIVLDLDHFKRRVEELGAEIALKIEQECGRVIHRLLRETDTGARVQDRFYLLLPNTDSAGGVFLVGRIRESLGRLTSPDGRRSLGLTVSAGIASYPEALHDAQLLVRSSLKALSQAKSGGRNRAVVAPLLRSDKAVSAPPPGSEPVSKRPHPPL